MKIFLGGTCRKSKWRDKLIPLLTMDYFDPRVRDWTPECVVNENKEKDLCDIILYVMYNLQKPIIPNNLQRLSK